MQLTLSIEIMQATTSVAFLQILRWYFLLLVCWVDLSVAIMQVTVSVTVMLLEVSVAHMQVTVSAVNMRMIIFIVIMKMGVSVAIMQVVFSAVHYAHDCVYCNYASDSFHKTDQKTFESIVSGLHFNTFVNILPKLRYFEGKNYTQIGYKSYSVLLFSQETYERWGDLRFLQRGNLRKGWALI